MQTRIFSGQILGKSKVGYDLLVCHFGYLGSTPIGPRNKVFEWQKKYAKSEQLIVQPFRYANSILSLRDKSIIFHIIEEQSYPKATYH